METRRTGRWHQHGCQLQWSLPVAVALAAAAMCAGSTAATTDNNHSTARRLVDEARQAAKSGDRAQQFALLRQAVRAEPDNQLARWQLGQIQQDGSWLAVEEAQRRAAADPKQVQYRELRRQYGENPAGQLALARWCRKNDLAEESQFHWASVLAVDPRNEKALRALELRWHKGRLTTRDEVAQAREALHDSKRAAKRWTAAVARWQRTVAGTDAAEREAAFGEIRSLTEVEAIPAVEKFTLGPVADKRSSNAHRKISVAFITALAAISDTEASNSLVRHAVFSPVGEVNSLATQSLKSRPPHEYVPQLLSGLSMPIESSFSVTTGSDGSVYYVHSLYREGPESDWSADVRRSAMQHDLGGRRYTWDVATQTLEEGPPAETPTVVAAKKAVVAARHQNRFGYAAADTESQVWQANQATEACNARIIPVLRGATGQELENPTAWWDWWLQQNEYYAADEKPVERYYDSDTDSYFYGYPSFDVRYPQPPPRKYSCFARGTPVWTKTGQQPIESLELGDLVLAQDVETGELAYKPIVARTVRPPSPILKISLGDEELLTTRGHPFWVSGVGWRMSKELGDGAVLHGITGTPRVESLEAAGEAEAYNLVVADFNTYFVGASGVLVHDNTPRKPTRAAVPGLAELSTK